MMIDIDPALLHLIPWYLVLGAFVGFCAGLLGIGGGTILVPALYYLFEHVGGNQGDEERWMHVALATSMAVILPTGLSSSWAQIKRQAVDWDAVKLMSGGLIVGSVMGVVLVTHLSNDILKIIFAVGLYAVAVSIFFRNEHSRVFPILKNKMLAVPFSTIFGIAATLLGMGGAVMNIPYLNRAGYPLKTAIATASVLGVVVSIPAIISYVVGGDGAFGYINPVAWAMIVPLGVLFAPLGVRVSHALPVGKLKLIFAVLMILVATKMVFEIL